jgi:hypothetical protein
MGIDYGYNIKKTMTYVMGWYPEVSTWLAQWKNPPVRSMVFPANSI